MSTKKAGCVLVATLVFASPAHARQGVSTWRQYATPAEAGFSAERLQRAREFADSVRSGAVMAVYRGTVIAAWGDVARKLELHSVRKSLVSALFGAGVAEGRIDLDRTLGDLGIDDDRALTAQEKQARVRDVIAARSGIYLPAAYAASDQDDERPARGSHAPGTRFFYNNWDFNIAGVIWERLTGENLYEGFARRFARPLGMEDYSPGDGYLVYEPTNSKHPAHTIRMSTRDLARFGQLYLQAGEWNGQRLLPASWIRESTRAHTDFENGQGYGLMWWTYAAGSLGARYPQLSRYGAYAGQGTGGQMVLVVPAADLVVVHRGDTDNGRRVTGRDAWMIAEMILAAREAEPAAGARVVALDPVPFRSQAPAPPMPTYATIAAALMAEYAGDYVIAPEVVARVFTHAGRLFINMPGQGEAELLALTQSEFTIKPVPGVRVVFIRDEAGRVTQLEASIGPQRFKGTRRDRD